MKKRKLLFTLLLLAISVSFVYAQEGKTLKRKVAIGRFSNETQYGKGLFYDKENDPMRKQALDILSSKLAASGKFIGNYIPVDTKHKLFYFFYQF